MLAIAKALSICQAVLNLVIYSPVKEDYGAKPSRTHLPRDTDVQMGRLNHCPTFSMETRDVIEGLHRKATTGTNRLQGSVRIHNHAKANSSQGCWRLLLVYQSEWSCTANTMP